MNQGLDLQPQQQGYPWMEMPSAQFPQEQGGGYGDLAGALVGRGIGKMGAKKPGQKMYDSPMPNNPLPMVGALAGLPMNT